MLDENLPTFYIQPSSSGSATDYATIRITQYGNEATPVYALRRLDSSLPDSKNQYAIAIYDAYSPEICFGEVVIVPTWTKVNPTTEEIRLNNGIPPPPQPVVPSSFVIQLYNPDQQVLVRQKKGNWNPNSYWDFKMPQITFRQPSSSTIDRSLNDPAVSETTPKLDFRWRKDGQIASKNLTLSLCGKSTNPDGTKRKNREPDITIALFRHLKDVTIYEPNLSRVEMEDFKGLEMVLLLSSIVIRDVYMSSLREAFNISTPDAAISDNPSVLTRKTSTHSNHSPQPSPRISPTNEDPMATWAAQAQAARIRADEEAAAKARAKAESASRKQVAKILAAEEKERRRRQAEIDKETSRLRREYAEEERRARQSRHSIARYGNASTLAPVPERPHSFSSPGQQQQPPPQGWWPSHSHLNIPSLRLSTPQPLSQQTPYLQPAPAASSSTFFHHPTWNATTTSLVPSGQNHHLSSSGHLNPNGRPRVKEKRSFFGLRTRGLSEGGNNGRETLSKKRSSMF